MAASASYGLTVDAFGARMVEYEVVFGWERESRDDSPDPRRRFPS